MLSRLIAAAAIAASIHMPATAEEEGAIPPALVGELEDFSKDEKMAYALGVLQTMTYLTGTTSGEYEKAACIAGQETLAYQTLMTGEADSPAALEIEIAVTEACDSRANGSTGNLLASSDAEEWFGGGRPEMERALFVYGLSDTLFFRVYTRVEDSVAECVHEMSQIAMSPDNDFSRQILADPSDPLITDLVERPVAVCMEE